MPNVEITSEMIDAARAAEAEWFLYQSGHRHTAIYFAMRQAAGVPAGKIEAERLGHTVEHLKAGIDGEAEWHANGQSGPLYVAIYRAMLAAR